MQISDEANAIVKKMVFDRFDRGKIHDIRLELSFDSFGDECNVFACTGNVPVDVEVQKGR